MVGYGGIGGLPQTRDLFTAPGSLLGADPYFQDIQRFQDGGFNDANPGGLPDYASLLLILIPTAPRKPLLKEQRPLMLTYREWER